MSKKYKIIVQETDENEQNVITISEFYIKSVEEFFRLCQDLPIDVNNQFLEELEKL